MEAPSYILYFAEKIGKPVSSFTKDDWKRAAILAATYLDEAIPTPKRPGRPKKPRCVNKLYELRYREIKNPVGRPIQTYGKKKLTAADISELLEIVMKALGWRNQTKATQLILRAIGGHAGSAPSVLRSVRTYRKQLQKNS